MRVVSLLRFQSDQPQYVLVALAAIAILALALLAIAAILVGSALSAPPDGQLLAPFRWMPDAMPRAG